MGFLLDIYVLVEKRAEHFDRLISSYCDYEDVFNREDEEVFWRVSQISEQSVNLDHIKSLAFDSRRNDGFTIYLKPSDNDIDIRKVIISFTNDEKMVLGLSVEGYEDDTQEICNDDAVEKAKASLKMLFPDSSLISVWETPPPETEQEFVVMVMKGL